MSSSPNNEEDISILLKADIFILRLHGDLLHMTLFMKVLACMVKETKEVLANRMVSEYKSRPFRFNGSSNVKADIHPEYKTAKVTCSCGNTFETRSTTGDIHVEICSACHPFYTGKQKIVDTEGRVERFYRKYGKKPAKAQA